MYIYINSLFRISKFVSNILFPLSILSSSQIVNHLEFYNIKLTGCSSCIQFPNYFPKRSFLKQNLIKPLLVMVSKTPSHGNQILLSINCLNSVVLNSYN